MRTDTLAVRDRLLAILREANTWVATNKIAAEAGCYYAWQRCSNQHPPEGFTCDGQVDLIRVPMGAGNRCWRELEALAAQGFVEKISNPGNATLWAYVTLEEDPTEMLHAMWDAPVHEDG